MTLCDRARSLLFQLRAQLHACTHGQLRLLLCNADRDVRDLPSEVGRASGAASSSFAGADVWEANKLARDWAEVTEGGGRGVPRGVKVLADAFRSLAPRRGEYPHASAETLGNTREGKRGRGSRHTTSEQGAMIEAELLLHLQVCAM